jgi:GAF domain-containing protein
MCEKMLGAERASIFIIDVSKSQAWVKAGTGIMEKAIEVPTADSLVGRAMASREPVVETGLENRKGVHERIAEETGFVSRDAICVPIKSAYRDEVIGAIEVMNKRDSQGFGPEDIHTLEEIAFFLQEEIERAFLNQEVLGATERVFAFASRAVWGMGALLAVVLAGIAAVFVVEVLAPVFF